MDRYERDSPNLLVEQWLLGVPIVTGIIVWVSDTDEAAETSPLVMKERSTVSYCFLFLLLVVVFGGVKSYTNRIVALECLYELRVGCRGSRTWAPLCLASWIL